LDAAVADGYLGAEWWTQTRSSDDPKEFHLDTAITWCRDNGWPADMLTACHFYPTVGSVFYLSDLGGPTVVFNQTMGERGMTPALPGEVVLVEPRANRLLLFKGNRFHGVMRPIDGGQHRRETLLVNYWSSFLLSVISLWRFMYSLLLSLRREKTAGETTTPVIATEKLMIQKSTQILTNKFVAFPQSVPLVELRLNASFQVFPPSLQ